MDTVSALAEVLNSGGTVAMCAVLMWYIKYITDQHKKEIDDLKEVLQRETVVLQRILDKLNINADLTKEE